MTLRVYAVRLSLEPWRKEGSAGRKEGGQRRNLSGVLMHAVPTKTRFNPRVTEGGPQRESFVAFKAQVSFTDPSFSVWSLLMILPLPTTADFFLSPAGHYSARC